MRDSLPNLVIDIRVVSSLRGRPLEDGVFRTHLRRAVSITSIQQANLLNVSCGEFRTQYKIQIQLLNPST